MKFIKNLELFLESNNKKGNINLITDICVAMLLINPSFLDNILDKGQRSRYQHNTSVFLNDLKNLVLSKNRLKLGKREEDKYTEEENLGKINRYFNEHSQDFDMEGDWSKLSKCRDIARNIQDKLLLDQKLSPSNIKSVYWVSPNKEDNKIKEDIVVELNDGRQFPLVVNSKLNMSKTKSFNSLLDIMLDQQADKLFSDIYLQRWDKLTQEWFKLVYNNCKTEFKVIIDEYIDATRADSLTHFDYLNIEIQNPEFKILGKYVPQLGKNYKELSKLLSDIWKQGVKAIDNYQEVKEKWSKLKRISLNNRIIEHLMVDSLNNLIEGEVKRTEDGYVIADDKVKFKLLRLVVELMGSEDIDVYYVSKTDFHHIPSKEWFRENYSLLNVEYDYHQKVTEENDSQFRIRLEYNNRPLLEMELSTNFSGGEMSGKLNTKMKITYESDFNYKVKGEK